MAIFTPGVAVGHVSGRVGGTIFSHNRGGMYMRNGTKPSKVVTAKALLYKGYFTAVSQAWKSLTTSQRQAWTTYAQTQTKSNRLGRSISLTGQSLFIGLNARLLALAVDVITAPPITSRPAPIVPTSLAVDAKTGESKLAFTDTPLDANVHLWIRGAKVNSAAIMNVENLLTTVLITAKAATSPAALEAGLIAAFGAIQEGATYVLECRTIDETSGLVSGSVYIRTVAVDTTA